MNGGELVRRAPLAAESEILGWKEPIKLHIVSLLFSFIFSSFLVGLFKNNKQKVDILPCWPFTRGQHRHTLTHSIGNFFLFKGTVSTGSKLFWISTHLLCANNNCSKVFILKKSKIHVRRHFPRIDMRWRPLSHVCLWLHASSCLHSTRRRYIVSINMASIKA